MEADGIVGLSNDSSDNFLDLAYKSNQISVNFLKIY